jgi:2-polyprenyl-6-methoxyphenol hydroxylase-like FAD-dependent oxidoreductase
MLSGDTANPAGGVQRVRPPGASCAELRTRDENRPRRSDLYRLGRVFLAGDAANIFNAGGSALNTGIQDALGLAGRLIAVVRDGVSVDELSAYEAARHATKPTTRPDQADI